MTLIEAKNEAHKRMLTTNLVTAKRESGRVRG